MQPLSQEFLDQCPVVGGFRQRGMEMTRIEVFVDAAFAFAITMLVISFDEIPRSFAEMVTAIKGVPAFLVAMAQLVWVWHEHNVWSRRFGLDDAMTVVLSACLVGVVLVYIYPLRVMAQGMFAWMTDGWLPSTFALASWEELRFMFVFMGSGFFTLCLVFTFLYLWTLRRADELRLSGLERFQARTVELIWLGFAVTGLVSVTLAVTLPDEWVPYSGFAYALMALWGPWLGHRRDRLRAARIPAHH